jgi:hypothetical protein
MGKEKQRPGIDRRTTLKLIGTAVPALALSTESAWAGKMSQKAARYQDDPKNGQECDKCKFFESPHSCKVVDGTISPEGWCVLYRKT